MGLRHLINGAAGINSSLWERARAYVLLPRGCGYSRYGTGMVGSAQMWHRCGTDVSIMSSPDPMGSPGIQPKPSGGAVEMRPPSRNIPAGDSGDRVEGGRWQCIALSGGSQTHTKALNLLSTSLNRERNCRGSSSLSSQLSPTPGLGTRSLSPPQRGAGATAVSPQGCGRGWAELWSAGPSG